MNAKTKSGIKPEDLVEGTRIDMGDEGEGLILRRVVDNIYLHSRVYSGWIKAQDLAEQLSLNIDDEEAPG